MTSFLALDGVTSFLRFKDVTITCKRMQRSLSIDGSFSVQCRKVGRSLSIGGSSSVQWQKVGRKIMLKCAILANFLDFENGCCYLNTIARKRRKTHGFLVFLLKNIHHFIGLNILLSYISMVMG